MSITSEAAWRADGAPWRAALPIAALARLLQGYGYTVGIIGNQAHLSASPPEDHTPYSHTPWPGFQPYPYVLALDIEAAPAGLPSTAQLGGQLYADKMAVVPGTQPVKYINWTDPHGSTWHDQWEPGHQRSGSVDKGHTHVSMRTDFVSSTIITTAGYDPVVRYMEAHGMAVDINLAQMLTPDLSLRNALVSTYVRSLPDAAARFDAILLAAHNDSETEASIAPAARAQMVADLLAALPAGTPGAGPSAAEIAVAVADEVDSRARARLAE